MKKYKEAVNFYTQGLGDLDPVMLEETKRTLWCNRAACHLELGELDRFDTFSTQLTGLLLGNYRSCLRDCASVLTPSDKPVPEEDAAIHASTNLKALFRCSKALIALERLDDAKDALERFEAEGGKMDPAVQKMQKALLERITYRDKLRHETSERKRRQEETDQSLSTAIQVCLALHNVCSVLVMLNRYVGPWVSATRQMVSRDRTQSVSCRHKAASFRSRFSTASIVEQTASLVKGLASTAGSMSFDLPSLSTATTGNSPHARSHPYFPPGCHLWRSIGRLQCTERCKARTQPGGRSGLRGDKSWTHTESRPKVNIAENNHYSCSQIAGREAGRAASS